MMQNIELNSIKDINSNTDNTLIQNPQYRYNTIFDSSKNHTKLSNKFNRSYKKYKLYTLYDIIDYLSMSYKKILQQNKLYIIINTLFLILLQAIFFFSFDIRKSINVDNVSEDKQEFININLVNVIQILDNSILKYLLKLIFLFLYYKVSLSYNDIKFRSEIAERAGILFDNISTEISKQINDNKMNLLLESLPQVAQKMYYIKTYILLFSISVISYLFLYVLFTKFTKNLFTLPFDLVQLNIGIGKTKNSINTNLQDIVIIKIDEYDYLISFFVIFTIHVVIMNYLIVYLFNQSYTTKVDTFDNNLINLFKNIDIFMMTNNLTDSVMSIKKEQIKNPLKFQYKLTNTIRFIIILLLILLLIGIYQLLQFILNKFIINVRGNFSKTIISSPILLLMYIYMYKYIEYYSFFDQISKETKKEIPKFLVHNLNSIVKKDNDIKTINSIILKDLKIGYDPINPLLYCEFLALNNKSTYLLLGPNGCGKSTILSSIIGRIPSNFQGNIEFIDNDGKKFNLKNISNTSLNKLITYITPGDKLSKEPLRNLFKRYNQNIKDIEIKDLLQNLNILDCFLKSNIYDENTLEEAFNKEINTETLSGGQIHRLILASKICNPETKVWLLDEILDSINSEMALSILKFLQNKAIEDGKILVLISHKASEIQKDDIISIVFDYDGNMSTNKGGMIK